MHRKSFGQEKGRFVAEVIGKHVEEDTLELYAMKRLHAEEVDRVDDHLFLCETCRERLLETERYITGFRLAARQLQLGSEPGRVSAWDWLRERLTPRQGIAALAACASLAMVLVVTQQNSQPVSYLDVTLRATRGVESTLAAANGRVHYRLHLDVNGLDVGPSGVVVLVNQSGGEVARESGRMDGSGEMLVELGKRLKPGAYFVRLASQTDPARLLREFKLEVE